MLKLNDSFVKPYLTDAEVSAMAPFARQAFSMLKDKTGAGSDFLGWVDLPVTYDRKEWERIKIAAQKIRQNSDVLVVIGIGGSYLGARAAIEFLHGPLYNSLPGIRPEIYFAGNTLSGAALQDLLAICEGRDICINVISKSGTTTEPAVAFRVFKKLLVQKYGEAGARERIFVTTDRARGTLKTFSDAAGYETFVVPDDVGGRYSVLSAVGMLPIAAAGIDIDSMIAGAACARAELSEADVMHNDAIRYAVMRNILYNKGKNVEILAGYEPYLLMLNEWWKQLFGESEGKDAKGLLPDSVIFSTDLHSLGQYIQQGRRDLFETVIHVSGSAAPFAFPADEDNVDGLNFLAGKQLDEVNHTAMFATLMAHTDGGVPNLVLELQERSAYSFGYLVYFFELACAVSGYILGVNPFDQPGVEAYKKNMFALLGKPGYEAEGEKLRARMDAQICTK